MPAFAQKTDVERIWQTVFRMAVQNDTIAESFPASDPPSSDPNPDDDTLIEPEPPDDIQG